MGILTHDFRGPPELRVVAASGRSCPRLRRSVALFVHEIPRRAWPSFCAAFSRQHENWLVTIICADSAALALDAAAVPLSLTEGGPGHAVLANAPLVAVLPVRGPCGLALSVLAGHEPGPVLRLVLPDVRRLWIQCTAAGRVRSLRIDAGYRSVFVQLRPVSRIRPLVLRRRAPLHREPAELRPQ